MWWFQGFSKCFAIGMDMSPLVVQLRHPERRGGGCVLWEDRRCLLVDPTDQKCFTQIPQHAGFIKIWKDDLHTFVHVYKVTIEFIHDAHIPTEPVYIRTHRHTQTGTTHRHRHTRTYRHLHNPTHRISRNGYAYKFIRLSFQKIAKCTSETFWEHLCTGAGCHNLDLPSGKQIGCSAGAATTSNKGFETEAKAVSASAQSFFCVWGCTHRRSGVHQSLDMTSARIQEEWHTIATAGLGIFQENWDGFSCAAR